MKVPLLFTLATIALGAALVSCGDSEEVAPDVAPAATTAAATIPVTPSPPPAPIPADWPTYTDPDGRFTFRYPLNWYVEPGGSVYSWNYTVASRPFYPPDGIAVQVISGPADKAESRSADATDAVLGGQPGWEVISTYTPTAAEGKTMDKVLATDRGGVRFFLVGSFGPSAVHDVFSLIAATFLFTK